MKLCLISREFAPFFGAGIGTYAACWARALASAGHTVHVVTRNHEGIRERAPDLYPGITFHVIDPADGPPKLDHNYPYARHALAVLNTVRRLHAQIHFDAIEYPDYWAEGHALSQAKRTTPEFDDTTLVCRLHTSSALCRDLDNDSTYPHYAAYLDIMEHESIAHADLVLSPSTDLLRLTRDYLKRHDLGAIRRAHVLRYPFDPASISDLRQSSDSVPSQNDPTVLYFGRMEHRKGVDLLVQAAQQLLAKGLRARFRFVGGDTGSGPFGRSMRKYAQKLVAPKWANHFEFLPPVPRAQLGPLIDHATLCCFPARWDNFPNALLEAMSAARPVVSTNTGGPGEIIQHESSGLLCDPTPESLAEALERALTDHDLRARIAANAPARIAQLCAPKDIINHFRAHTAGVDVPRGTPAEKPLVSVIVPHYNLAQFLPETLASVRAQTYPNIETIVIDDGSTDPEALRLIDSLSEPNLRVVRQENRGLSGARNTGLREARGELVLPLDADDLIAPEFVERAVGALAREPSLAYVTALVGYFRQEPGRFFGGWVPLGLHRDLLPIHNCAGCCMSVFRAAAVRAAGGYAEELTSYEDWDLYCALAERGERGAVIPGFLLHYRLRADSLLRTEVRLRRQHLHARVLARHPGLPRDHSRVLRTMLSEQMEAGNLQRAGLRYRVADRVNEALKASPVHGLVKGLAQRTIEMKNRTRHKSEI